MSPAPTNTASYDRVKLGLWLLAFAMFVGFVLIGVGTLTSYSARQGQLKSDIMGLALIAGMERAEVDFERGLIRKFAEDSGASDRRAGACCSS